MGLGNVPGENVKTRTCTLMKTFNIHGIVSWIHLNLAGTHGKLCTVRFSASSPKLGC